MNVYLMCDLRQLSAQAITPDLDQTIADYVLGRIPWQPLQGVLPFGHNMTGPFGYRGALSPSDLELPAEMFPAHAKRISLIRGPNRMSSERLRIQAMKKSDVGFLWLDDAHTLTLMDAAMLYGMGKEVVVAASRQEYLQAIPMAAELMYLHGILADTPKAAYEAGMADIAVHIKRGFVLMTSKYSGLCRGCGGAYFPNEPIMWSRLEGVYHKDCYDSMKDPSKTSAALFTSDLVNTLRGKNAELERECAMLMARISELERKVFSQ